MEAVTAPGTICDGVLGKHPATIVIIEDSEQKGLNGYLEIDVLDVGKLAGSDTAHLRISYPWQDGGGSTISLTRSGATTLTGEFNGATTFNKHCTFDIGLMLELVDDEKAAEVTLKRLATQFEAKAALHKAALAKIRVNALAQEGRMLLVKAEYEEALKVLMQAYQLNPRNKDSIHTVMAVYFRSGRYNEAISFLEQAGAKLEQAADRKEINDIIALIYFKKGLKDAKSGTETEAEASLRKAVALNPQSARYLEALVRMRHKAGHFDEAEKLLSQGLDRITDESSRRELMALQEKLRQTEMIIKKLQ
jgi:tetratricopeptide (TPR) repeat protein